MRDPLRSPGAANVGAAGLSRVASPLWELGVIVAYNSATHTATIRTNSGRPLQDVPQIKPTGGGFDHLETGTNVVICWNLGFPAILGCMDFVGFEQAALTPPSITGTEGYGDADPTQATEGNNTYKPPTAPVDMQAGDWAQVGTDGNHVAVLAGGMTTLGSPTAHVRSFGRSGVLQHIARRLETYSDFGQWRIENDQGRTSFVLRAGTGQATQTGLDEQHWTIRFDLGATGDILDFSISEPAGKLLFRLHAGSDGRVQLYGDGGVDISSGNQGTNETRHDIAGRRVAAITSDDVTTIQGSRVASVNGNCDTEIAGDFTHVIGGSRTVSVSGDEARSVGHDLVHVITNDRAVRIGGKATTEVGKDLVTKADGAVKVTAGAAMRFHADGDVAVEGSQIRLGDGSHPMPKWDVFLTDTTDFLIHLIGALGALTPSNPFVLSGHILAITKYLVFTAQRYPYQSFKCSNE